MSEVTTARVSVTPEEFTFVTYDGGEIARIVAELAAQLELANPIEVIVDETTPLAKMSAEIGGASSDATVTLRFESGALENTQRPMSFSEDAARQAIGRMLLRAHDRMRDDFADTPADVDLSLTENAAWDTYCAGRLARMGVAVNQQRWRYNHRNRFGFRDDVDGHFDRLWTADDLGWADLTATP